MMNRDLVLAGAEPEVALPSEGNTYLRLIVPLLVAAGLLALVPLWPALFLAIWLANIARPLHGWLARRVGGRSGAAAVITVVGVLVALTPVVGLVLSLISAALNFFHELQGTKGFGEGFQTLLASEPTLSKGDWNPQQLIDLVKQHGGSAARVASTVFGATAAVVIGLFVFVYGFYVCLVDGRRAHAWMLDHVPLRRDHTIRLSAAFIETGRGLLIGVGGTALFQGVLATLGYALIGLPQALVLGLLTFMAALIPSIGTGLVWVPICIALYVSDRTTQAALVLGVGTVSSLADNFLGPALAKIARLKLPTFVVLAAMLGGITIFGGWGIVAGPLLVRLAVEAASIWRAEHERQSTPLSTAFIETNRSSSNAPLLHG